MKKINYHIFSHNRDEYTTDLEEANEIFKTFVAENDSARLYKEIRDGEGELLEENCLKSHGDYPY